MPAIHGHRRRALPRKVAGCEAYRRSLVRAASYCRLDGLTAGSAGGAFAAARHSPGVMLNARLNIRLKCAALLKPTRYAISLTAASADLDVDNHSRAICSRFSQTSVEKDTPCSLSKKNR